MLSGLLITLNVLVCIALIGVVLLQRSEGGGFVGGGSSNLITTRGAGDLLTRTTWVLFGMFMVLSLGLTLLGVHDRSSSSVLEKLKGQVANTSQLNQTNAAIPTAPSSPLSGPAPAGPLSPFTAPPATQVLPPASAPTAATRAANPAARGPAHVAKPATGAPPAAQPAPAAEAAPEPVLIAPPPQPAPKPAPPAPKPADPNAPVSTGTP